MSRTPSNRQSRPSVAPEATGVVSMRLDETLRRRLVERAHAQGCTLSALLRSALDQWLAQQGGLGTARANKSRS